MSNTVKLFFGLELELARGESEFHVLLGYYFAFFLVLLATVSISFFLFLSFIIGMVLFDLGNRF